MTALSLCTICTHKPRLPGVVRCDSCQTLWNSMRRTVSGRRLAPTHDQVRAHLGKPLPARVRHAGHGSLRDQIKRDPEVQAALGVLRDAQAQRKGRQGYIYCIAEKGVGGFYGSPVKIGYSVKPEARPAELQTGNPRPLKLLGQIKGTRATERALHEKYINQNLVGEWFRPTTALLSEFGIIFT